MQRNNVDDDIEQENNQESQEYDDHAAAEEVKNKDNYIREGGKEYIVKKISNAESLTGRMIIKNKIESLISASLREFNGESFLYYDISGKIRFSDMFSGENDIMEKADVERLCQSFSELASDLRDYLLDAEEMALSPENCFYDSDKKRYEFLYIPGKYSDRKETKECDGSIDGSFNEGIKAIWDRVMEKFNHQSDLETIARVYDIYQKVSMLSFDPEEVFSPAKAKSSEGEKQISKQDRFGKELLKEKIAGGNTEGDVAETINEEKTGAVDEKGNSFIDGLKLKLAGSAGFLSVGTDKQIDEISKNMEKEDRALYKIKNYLAVNSGNIFKVLMCVALLFIIIAFMPSSLAFKPPVSACVGVFLVCVAAALYAKKLGKEKAEEELQTEGTQG